MQKAARHAGCGVVRGDVLLEVIARELPYVGGGAKDGASKGAVLERGRVQVVEDHLLRHFLHLGMRLDALTLVAHSA